MKELKAIVEQVVLKVNVGSGVRVGGGGKKFIALKDL